MFEWLENKAPCSKPFAWWPDNSHLSDENLRQIARVCKTLTIQAEYDDMAQIDRIYDLSNGVPVGVVITGTPQYVPLEAIQNRILVMLNKLKRFADNNRWPYFVIDHEPMNPNNTADTSGPQSYSVLTGAISHWSQGRSKTTIYGYGCRENGAPQLLFGTGNAQTNRLSMPLYKLPDLAGSINAVESTIGKYFSERRGASDPYVSPFVSLGCAYVGSTFQASDWDVSITKKLANWLAMSSRVWDVWSYPGACVKYPAQEKHHEAFIDGYRI